MDIHWRNKGFIIALALMISLSSCRAKKKIAENVVTESVQTTEKVETLVVKEPYKIEAKETVYFDIDTIGEVKIKPIKISIKKDDIIGEVTIENNEVTYSLEKKDTTIVSREIKESKVSDIKKDTVTEIEVKKSLLEKISDFSQNLILFAVIIGVLYLVYRILRKTTFPL